VPDGNGLRLNPAQTIGVVFFLEHRPKKAVDFS
jgi:hypothetical protein